VRTGQLYQGLSAAAMLPKVSQCYEKKHHAPQNMMLRRRDHRGLSFADISGFGAAFTVLDFETNLLTFRKTFVSVHLDG
jgi:hypothetical protein